MYTYVYEYVENTFWGVPTIHFTVVNTFWGVPTLHFTTVNTFHVTLSTVSQNNFPNSNSSTYDTSVLLRGRLE